MIYDIEKLDSRFVEEYFISFPMTYKLWLEKFEDDVNVSFKGSPKCCRKKDFVILYSSCKNHYQRDYFQHFGIINPIHFAINQYLM